MFRYLFFYLGMPYPDTPIIAGPVSRRKKVQAPAADDDDDGDDYDDTDDDIIGNKNFTTPYRLLMSNWINA